MLTHSSTAKNLNIHFSPHTNVLLHGIVSLLVPSSRTAQAILTGATAGILGLTSWKGFVFYAIASFVLSVREVKMKEAKKFE